MRRVVLAGLRAHRLRLLLTALSIVLGVGFLASTLIYADTARAAFFNEFAHSARNVDVAVESGKTELPPSTLAAVRGVPGVAVADGTRSETLPMLDHGGRLIANFGAAGTGYAVSPHAALRDYAASAGRLPARAGEAALDTGTASRHGYHVGDAVVVLDAHGHRHSVRLTGTVRFGSGNADGTRLVVMPADLTAFTGHDGYREILATAAPGVDPTALRDRVRAALGAGHTVETGDALRTALATRAVSQVNLFLAAIGIFGVIALIVAAFVIYNTFTILIAQRRRELALLRCVGASRRQVFGAVLAEAAAVGAVGAALGLLVGVGLAGLMSLVLRAVGLALPAHALVVSGATVAIGLVVGVVVTVASAVLPAVAATRVAPVAALRADPEAGATARHTVVRVVAAVLVGGVGVAVTLAGTGQSAGSDPDGTVGLVLVVAGGLVVFLGLVIVSPLFLGRLTALLGWLPGRLFGVPARLASANARRNPARVAATTTALMIGVALMTIFTVMLATVHAVADTQLTKSFPADYLLNGATAGTQRGVPAGAVDALRARHELSGVAELRSGPGTLNGQRQTITGFDTGGVTDMRPTTTAGSFAALRAGTIALHVKTAMALHVEVGDRVSAVTAGTTHRYRVVVIYTGSAIGNALLSWGEFGADYGPGAANSVLVRAGSGVTPADSRAAVDAALRDYPLVQVSSMAATRANLASSLDTMLGVFAALLGISIIIALFGIANTLSLSVFERTRESALLRALGLTRGQLASMLLVEALLMAVVGALVGIAFGIVYGAAATTAALSGLGGTLQVPVGRLLLYLGLAAVAGVLAAVLPARRAARTSIVAAI